MIRPSRNKFGAKKCQIDGYTFDSLAEGRRFQELKLLERAGEIRLLRVHPRYPLTVNGQMVATYEADFAYEERVDGVWQPLIIEDVKGMKTPVYTLKKALMLACNGIAVRETSGGR